MQTVEWTTHPQAEALVTELVADAVASSPRVADLGRRLIDGTSTTLTDWLDHIAAPVDAATLSGGGFTETRGPGLWRHPAAQLPAVVPSSRRAVALRVDDAAAFAAAHRGGPVDA